MVKSVRQVKCSRVSQAKVLQLLDIAEFDIETTVGKPIVVSIFNHRNVGHKKHIRPTRLRFCKLLRYSVQTAIRRINFIEPDRIYPLLWINRANR